MWVRVTREDAGYLEQGKIMRDTVGWSVCCTTDNTTESDDRNRGIEEKRLHTDWAGIMEWQVQGR